MKRLLAALMALCMLTACALAEAGADGQQPPEIANATEPPVQEVKGEKEEPLGQEPPPATGAPGGDPTGGPTGEPTGAPGGDPPGGDPTGTPGGDPTGDPTDAPATAPSVLPSGAPGETPAAGPTGEPPLNLLGGDPTDDPEATVPVIPADAEAWMLDPADSRQVIAGKLEDILRDFDAATEATVYIRSKELMTVRDKTADDLQKTTLTPDEAVFEKGRFAVRLSDQDPTQIAPAGGGEGDGGAQTVLYIWVEEKKEAPGPSEKPGPAELDIFVGAEDYVPGAWSRLAPAFTLSGIPEDARGYTYAAIAYDEKFIVLSGNAYTARDEGEYTLRFAILDSIGDVAAISAKFDLKIDLTPPPYLTATLAGEGKTQFTLSSTDALSGLDAFSVDGGQSWIPADENGAYTHTGKLGEIYAQGMLLARDAAGNITEYPTDFEIPKPVVYPSYGGGGGGSGEGGASIRHTGDEDVDTTPYDALNLALSGEPMQKLTLGEDVLDLTLSLDSAENLQIGPLYQSEFTARLALWGDADPEEGAAPDTLVLEALLDPALEGEYTYLWRFNGAVYRMLFNSGVDYLVLRVGERVTAISTAGFTAGTEYTKLKAGGVSTRKFDYSVWMTGSTRDEGVEGWNMEADVEGEVYPLTGDETQPMYCYDLYYGPSELLAAPFGAWAQEEGDA